MTIDLALAYAFTLLLSEGNLEPDLHERSGSSIRYEPTGCCSFSPHIRRLSQAVPLQKCTIPSEVCFASGNP